MEAGNYNAAPSTLVQGAALQTEDLSTIMQNVCWGDKQLILQKMIKSDGVKSMLAQFDRQMSYGQFGGAAQLEGNVGQEETSEYARITVPMCFYSHSRRVTIASQMIETVDGVKSDERAAKDAALKIAGDIEFDLFRGKADFSNGGVFDGNPLAIPALPNITGLDVQIRQSDAIMNTQDAMFYEFGGSDSCVLNGGGPLTQDNVEDASCRSAQNHGSADKLCVDIKVVSAYNKIAYGKDRIILAGSPQTAQGADLRKQWVSGGTVDVEGSRFLAGKTAPQRARSNGPTAPTITGIASATVAGVVTPFAAGAVYQYYVTSFNEVGESPRTAATAGTVTLLGDELQVTIQPGAGTTRGFNVYRSAAGGTAASAKYIGRVANSGAASTVFYDLGNKNPAFVTGFLVQGDTFGMKELCPYSRLKLAVSDLSQPEAHFRFCTLVVFQPRKSILLDNLRGSF
jgi:hypothetical protein